MKYIFIKWSSRFWEVRPPTKTGMKKLLDYINMIREAKKCCSNQSAPLT